MITRVATRAMAALAVAALVVAAWAYRTRSPSPSTPSRPLPYGMSITDDIREDLARRGDVVYVNVWYDHRKDDPDRSPYAAAFLVVTSDAALDPVVDAATAAIWQSTLTPLRAIEITASVDGGADRVVIRTYAADGRDAATLRARYGPRPVG